MFRVWVIVGAVACLMMGLSPVGNASQASQASQASSRGSLNYGDFSMMYQRAAGQYQTVTGSPGDQDRGQWAQEPVDGPISRIRWGSAGDWPPVAYERFSRSADGKWVMLDGYGDDTGLFYRQVVTRERRGDVNCRNMKSLPLDSQGRQHYALWQVSGVASYCLEAWGYIEVGEERVDFYHKQVRFAPSMPGTCSNRWISGRTCIKQYEEWRDNNCIQYGGECNGPLERRHLRDNVLAQGLGPAFYVQNWDNGWGAQGLAYWRY